MTPHPTARLGLLRLPGPGLAGVTIRYSPLAARDRFSPSAWPQTALAASASFTGWWEVDLDALALADGDYEYEFVIAGGPVAADPYAETITRFGGYRGVFTIAGGQRVRKPFDWSDEFAPGASLPQNNQIVIYEMPVKWMASDPSENPLVELGTFDKVIFERVDDLAASGINCIELLPIQDTPQTLNWGYGTRFFFAPDYDIGNPVDARFFVKYCHQRGVRVILDVVMNMFEPQCPLAQFAPSWFIESPISPGRNGYDQEPFLYNVAAYGTYFAAREFLCEMAEYWVSEYHVDGYRVDDFADINNWEFVQDFHDRATARSQSLFPGKPFLVVAEDSNRRFEITASGAFGGARVADAIWNFGYRDEIRRLLTDSIDTYFGEPSRSVRVAHLISKDGVWNNLPRKLDSGYTDMACSVDYITSHDVADGPRLMNVILGPMLAVAGLGPGDIVSVSNAVDTADTTSNPTLRNLVQAALSRVFGAFGILMTSVGMPMFLAGEEFGDVHDLDFIGVNPKQQDPVQWQRAAYAGNAALLANVSQLIHLRASHPALQRNEVSCFYFHPEFDQNFAPRVFAYCRTAGKTLGTTGQVVVIANMGAANYASYDVPSWPWGALPLAETGTLTTGPVSYNSATGALSLSLGPFAVRVFRT
jgi:1,4-alpha-glucan branching enzyme